MLTFLLGSQSKPGGLKDRCIMTNRISVQKIEAKHIVDENYCTGCGACVAHQEYSGNEAEMTLTKFGELHPMSENREKLFDSIEKVCPFSSKSLNETQISNYEYENSEAIYHEVIGYYTGIYAGFSKNALTRYSGSGGGLLTEFLAHLLKTKIVDYVVHVGPVLGSANFEYKISKSISELKENSKSHYHPTSMEKVISKINDLGGTYVIVGVPCFIRAFYNLITVSKITKPVYRVGIVCGHLKNKQFTEMIMKRVGAENDQIKKVNFRITDQKARSNEYRMGVELNDGRIKSKSVQLIPGSNWGEGSFKLKGCDFCDDVFNECADVVFGDAWIEPYIKEGNGANIVVVRKKEIDKMLSDLQTSDRIVVNDLPYQRALKAQDATIRHRRVALKYRIDKRTLNNQWVPKKREFKNEDYAVLNSESKKIFDQRERLSEESKKVYSSTNSLLIYDMKMWPHRRRYFSYYKPKKYIFLPVELWRMLQIIKSVAKKYLK